MARVILPLAFGAVVGGFHAVAVCGTEPAHYPLVFDGGLKEAYAPLRCVIFGVAERGGAADDCCCCSGGDGYFGQGGLDGGILVGCCFGELVDRGVSIHVRGREGAESGH